MWKAFVTNVESLCHECGKLNPYRGMTYYSAKEMK